MQVLIEFLSFLEPYGTHSYFLMFAVLLACGFGFPMPEDVVLITGGILAARGITDIYLVNAFCFAGVMVGDGTVFFLGRRFGPAIKKKRFVQRIMSERMDRRVSAVFEKYGEKVIFMGRFMPGLRTPIFLTAGIYQLPPWKFFLLDGVAALISVPVWIWIGAFFGENLELLEAKIRQAQYGIYGVLAALLAGFVVVTIVKKRLMKSVA